MSVEKLIEKLRRQARVDCDPSNGSSVIQMRGRAIADCVTQLEAELPAIRELVEAAKQLMANNEEYVRRNNLGDPFHNGDMKRIRAAIKKVEE